MSLQGGQAAYLADMLQEAEDAVEVPSEIANFFAGCNVLITGGSGFLGRLLVEKLLRSCPNVAAIFLLIRAKKGKSSEVRFKEYFEDVVFDRLKAERPKYASKVVLVEGDCGEIGLGLSPENEKLLLETNVVLHGAATVRFDEKLRTAVNINVRGTKELLNLAKQMKDLKAFVHVSTAYSYCVLEEIEEKFYTSPMDADKLISLVDILDDAMLETILPKLLGEWPNTYAFTKAVAEDVVRRDGSAIGARVVRPSMVVGTSKEPISGWINNYYGPTGITLGVMIGLLHTLYCFPNNVADLIPADYVVNLILAAAWDAAKSERMNLNKVDDAPDLGDAGIVESSVYNCVSCCQKPITWGQYMNLNEIAGLEIPSLFMVWRYMFTLNKNLWVHRIQVLFLHLIPALIVDSVAFLIGKKPFLWKAYKKVHRFGDIIVFFTIHQWSFHNDNVLALWEKVNPTDRTRFDFNLDDLEWEEYLANHMRGIRVFLLKDPMETVPQGRAHYVKLKAAHYTVVTILTGLLLWICVLLLRSFGLW